MALKSLILTGHAQKRLAERIHPKNPYHALDRSAQGDYLTHLVNHTNLFGPLSRKEGDHYYACKIKVFGQEAYLVLTRDWHGVQPVSQSMLFVVTVITSSVDYLKKWNDQMKDQARIKYRKEKFQAQKPPTPEKSE